MNDLKWASFFHACADVLSVKPAGSLHRPEEYGSWCAWTTFDSLNDNLHYWRGPLPTPDEIFDTYLGHGANWSQFFQYQHLCHVLVPRTFFWERPSPGNYQRGDGFQDIEALSVRLNASDIPYRLTPLVLEIKLY
jgi:hypothetical protein